MTRRYRPVADEYQVRGDAIAALPHADMVPAINAFTGRERAEVIRWLVRMDVLDEDQVRALCDHSTKLNRDRDPTRCSQCLALAPSVSARLEIRYPEDVVPDEILAGHAPSLDIEVSERSLAAHARRRDRRAALDEPDTEVEP